VVSRSHLSIGEVLSLLHDEFPDVTISKIRFLESQGLVDPERTPSGYRKFYDADIERLRWVLRQQRDAFLPLKVIKGRLETQPEPSWDDTDEGPELEALGDELSEDEIVVVERTELVAVLVDEVEGGGSADEEDREGDHLLSATTAQLFDAGPPQGGFSEAAEVGDRPSPPRRSPAGPRGAPRGSGPRSGGKHGQRGTDGAAAREERPSREERSVGAHLGAGAKTIGTELAAEAKDQPEEDELTLDELLEETGVNVEKVRELEGFGLITPKVMGGSHYYTRDAAIVTQLASSFARHGVEARHLRAYKGAADREAGLVEQVIMPLIRQRNPEARQVAAETVEELSNLGGELRAVLLRSALADLR
jgi:DNA-binding transcriptional MerR regulator